MLATTVTNPLAEVVAADAVQQPNQKGISSEKNNDIKLSQEQIDQFDKFVVVKDNSYVLDSKVNQNFSTNEVNSSDHFVWLPTKIPTFPFGMSGRVSP
mgnify:CR=1 FL=1